jgi:beta-N-acetylhexosaminidase
MNGVAGLARGVIVAGISGTSIDAALPHFGGYLLFPGEDAPLRAVRALTDALRSSGDRPIVAIDQEGGPVSRLREDVEPMPPMMAVGAADDVDAAQRAGEQTAFDLRRAGCTLDFAPVLDLALDPENAVIGTRSFGADPQRVASLGAAFARGLSSGGIFPCYKHFPGHGSTAVDSHVALPVIDAAEATLRGRDIVPFAAVAAGAPAMMSAHVLARAFDSQRPATLSPRIATGLLRGELGFRGAFVTDCLEMKAMDGSGTESAIEALGAGADLLVFSHDRELAVAAARAIELAVTDKRLALERLEEAHARVMKLRIAGAPPLALDADAPHPGIGREIGRLAVTLLRGIAHADPVSSIAVSFGGQRTLAREAPVLEEMLVAADPDPGEMESVFAELARRGRRPLILARRAHRFPRQAAAVAAILDRYPDALAVSLFEPFGTALFAKARHLLAVYGDDPSSIGGLADVVFGGSMPCGRSPV